MASKQTSMMAQELPQFAAAYSNADTGRRWNVRLSYAPKIGEISEKNSKPLAKDGAALEFKSRTEALISSARSAKKSAEAAGIVAKEGHNGGYGCWKTADGSGRACWLFAYPAPMAAAELPKKEADKPAKPASKPAQPAKPAQQAIAPKAASKPAESAGEARRRIAAEQAAQKIAQDSKPAEAPAEAAPPAA